MPEIAACPVSSQKPSSPRSRSPGATKREWPEPGHVLDGDPHAGLALQGGEVREGVVEGGDDAGAPVTARRDRSSPGAPA